MDYEITKMGSFHKIILEATNEDLNEAIEKLKQFKCYSKSSDIIFTLFIQNLDIHIQMTEETLMQTMMQTENDYTLFFITYNDRSAVAVSLWINK